MDATRLRKPVDTLRKGLKKLHNDPVPERVHTLRTGARHIESLAQALLPANGHKSRRLLKAIKPVRRAAGGVRDMDVMTANALKLAQAPVQDSLTRLVEYLGAMRQHRAAELLDKIDRRRKPARRRLKQFAKRVEFVLKGKHSARRAAEMEAGLRDAANKLRGELSRWPSLGVSNIHQFRLKVKELRSLAQLQQDSNARLIRALGNTKNKIGDWHDWQQLDQIAAEVLDPRQDRALFIKIDREVKRKLRRALITSNALRRNFLHIKPMRSRAA